MDKTPRLLRFLIRGMQGFVMMLEEDEEIRNGMDQTTKENFLHWRERLNRITFAVDKGEPEPDLTTPRRRRSGRNLPG